MTSPEQGDGKSLVSSNLAAAFAMAGNTTVLVSGDLRRPQLDAAFGVAGHLGLADLLVDQRQHLPDPGTEHDTTRFPIVRATDFLCETDIPNLWILPAGTPTPNPAELLGSPFVTQVIDDIVKFADMVIIDCPPTVVTDGVVLAKHVDGAIVVTSMVKTHKSSLRAAVDRLDDGTREGPRCRRQPCQGGPERRVRVRLLRANPDVIARRASTTHRSWFAVEQRTKRLSHRGEIAEIHPTP